MVVRILVRAFCNVSIPALKRFKHILGPHADGKLLTTSQVSRFRIFHNCTLSDISSPRCPCTVYWWSCPHQRPTLSNCDANSTTCAKAWALSIVESTNVFIYGAGFYSFFDNYDETCVSTETCQDGLIYTSYSQGIWIYDIFTKGAYETVSPAGGLAPALAEDTQNGYCTAISAWLELADTGALIGGADASSGLDQSPTNVSIVPLACTSVAPTATFTLTPACASEIASFLPIAPTTFPQDHHHVRKIVPAAAAEWHLLWCWRVPH